MTWYLSPSSTATPSPAITVPILIQANLTSGAPFAEHLSEPVAPLSEADLDDDGDLSKTGGAVESRNFYFLWFVA